MLYAILPERTSLDICLDKLRPETDIHNISVTITYQII